ncbi:MAG: hypothetical protein HYT87_11350 [Nitrospirae bacterium]|nr:hypothetical protein [Nitrospirota bacterium]
MKVAFTGRRDAGPGVREVIGKIVAEEISLHAPVELLFGGASGADTIALDEAAKVIAELPSEKRTRLVVILPGRLPDQPHDARAVIEQHADEIHQLKLRPCFPSSYRKRNQVLVDRSDRVVAFWDGREKGGTHMTMALARKMGRDLRVVRIDRVEESDR